MHTEKTLSSVVYLDLENLLQQLKNTKQSHACIQLIQALCTALGKGESYQNLSLRICKERAKKMQVNKPLGHEEAQSDLAEVKRLRQCYQRRTPIPGARKLERYHQQIQALNHAGASSRDIKFWLFSHKKLAVSHHTVRRYINALFSHA